MLTAGRGGMRDFNGLTARCPSWTCSGACSRGRRFLSEETPWGGLSVDAQQQLLWVEAVGVDAAETSSEENGQVRENAPQQPPEDEEGSPIWHLLQAQRRNEQGPPFPAAISKTLSLSLPDREREKGEGLEAHVRRSQKLCLVLSLSLASREGNKWMGRSEVQAGVGV